MTGITFVYSKQSIKNTFNIKYFNKERYIINEAYPDNNTFIAKYSINKFENDKLFKENADYIIIIDGIVFNKLNLIEKYNANTFFDCNINMYEKNGEDYFKEFRGEFCGVFIDKKQHKSIVFTNHIGSKPVFYYYDENNIIFSSELKILSQLMDSMDIKKELDILGAYFMLMYGYMLYDYTIINNVKRLLPGNYAKIENNNIEIKRYHIFEVKPDYSMDKEYIIGEIDRLFINALKQEYEKDREYNYKHIVTLSGGVDSRTNVMISNELGYTNKTNITTAYKGFADENIARKVAKFINEDFIFHSLNNGDFLMNIDEPFMANDGLVFYIGSAHLLDLLKQIDFSQYGLLHTAMIGDGVMGNYLSNSKNKNNILLLGSIFKKNPELIDYKKEIKEVYKIYIYEEIFTLYNRGFNAMFNGNLTANMFSESTSTYTNVELLEFLLTVPHKFRKRTRIQIEWINKKHPKLTLIETERYRAKPKIENFYINYMRFFIKWGLSKTFGRYYPSTMVPYEYWYRKNRKLKLFFENYFKNNIEYLNIDNKLKNDAINTFSNGNVIEKSRVLTLLKAIKFYELQ